MKAHYPAHFLAGVLTHEPGMYPRRLILEDARLHDIPILPLDVNLSEPEYVVEPVGDTYGIRLALKDVHGMSDAEIRSILETRADRPFRDPGDFIRRAQVSQPVTEALAHAGAFDEIGGGTRRDRLYTALTTKSAREGEQQSLRLWDETDGILREYTDAERVRAELEVVGMDASRHILSFYEPLLDDLGVIRSKNLGDHRNDEWVMVAGVKVSSQTPQVRSNQRIIFLTLDDATGPVDVTVFERIQPKCAKTIFHGFVLAVWGRLRRTGLRGVSIIAEDVWDLTEIQKAGVRRSKRSLPPVKVWHASGGSAGW